MSRKGPDMVRLQAQIKNNHADITSYIEDLVTWTEDATVKEKNLKKLLFLWPSQKTILHIYSNNKF